MRRDVKTVQRWEKREGMPVHRHLHDKLGSVYAFRKELDGWAHNRRPLSASERPSAAVTATSPLDEQLGGQPSSDEAGRSRETAHASTPRRQFWLRAAPVALALVVALALAALQLRSGPEDSNPLASARFQPLTDFNGSEQAAAISRDGKLVAFLSDRDGRMDVWLTQVGSGEFHNLTHGAVPELINPSVRTLDFSPDGTLVTFWTRRLDASQQSQITIMGVAPLGGSPRVYLDGAAEYDWSDDARRMIYHTPAAGDPMFVRDADQQSGARQIFAAPAGMHAHFPIWSPDGAFVYFVQGSVADRMDVWRVSPSGGVPQRITSHDAAVTYPVFLNPRTLLYLATDRDGSGPWIYSVDVERRVPRRAGFGIDRYTSLAASGDGRHLVATLATPRNTLWRVPVGASPAQTSDARAIRLTTGNGASPRIGDGFLLYVSAKGTGDSIWKLRGEAASELWSAQETRVIGAPALARDGRRLAFSTRRHDGRTHLWVVNSDGTDAHTLPGSLELQGAPSWAPDGRTLTVGAVVDGAPNLFSVPLDGGPPARIVREHSRDPTWSPDGSLLLFSGADVGTTFKLHAVDASGQPRPIPELTLSRGARHVVFVEGQRLLVLLRGDLRHRNLWTVDLDTGAERQLTDFAPGFDVRDFDVSPDGRAIVVEQVQEQSDIVLLELPR